jgi:hypothetical protein
MTKRKAKAYDDLIDQIVEAMDEGRYAVQGGYPSQYSIIDNVVYMATVDHDDAPKLIILPIRDFIMEYSWAVGEEDGEKLL